MAEINIGDALSKPIDVMQRNPGIIVPALIPAVASLIFAAIFGGAMMASMGPGYGMNPMFIPGLFGVFAVYGFVMVILGLIANGAIISIAYSELNGRSANYMEGINDAIAKLAPLLIAAIIIAIGVTVGLILLVIPGLIFALLVMFAIQEIMIDEKDATSAISSSIELVKTNFGNVLVYAVILFIVVAVVSAVIGIVPVIGNAISTLIVTPYIGISVTYAYMQLTEQKSVVNQVS